ncbi:hypothetical protein F4810DRAFT_213396 [Camillea tinctor]|nr:hypothetical protein F4810DRAFT_213396 [Camillea tinctor]
MFLVANTIYYLSIYNFLFQGYGRTKKHHCLLLFFFRPCLADPRFPILNTTLPITHFQSILVILVFYLHILCCSYLPSIDARSLSI